MNLHFLLLALLELSPSSFATSIYVPSFSDFAKSTPNIVRGRITNVHAGSEITTDGIKGIYTYANFEIKESIKGSFDKTSITLKKVGGTVDGYTVEIPSSPEFKEGEETLLFLGPENEDHSFSINNLEIGKFELEEKGSETLIQGGVFNYSDSEQHPEPKDAASRPKKTWTLASLKALVHQQEESHLGPNQKVATPDSVSTKIDGQKSGQLASLNPTAESGNQGNTNTQRFAWLSLLASGLFLVLFLFFKFRKKA